MYSVSENYKAALQKKIIIDRISGKITLSDGNVINLSDNILVSGALKITHELCGNYKVGTFNLGCLKIGIYDDNALLRDFSGALAEPGESGFHMDYCIERLEGEITACGSRTTFHVKRKYGYF